MIENMSMDHTMEMVRSDFLYQCGFSLDALEEYLQKYSTLEINAYPQYIDLDHAETYANIFCVNLNSGTQEGVGKYELILSYSEYSRDSIDRLEENFENPLQPSTEECILYEMEFGYPYPLLEYLKEDYLDGLQ